MMGLGGSMSFGGLRQGMMNSAMADPLSQGGGQLGSGGGMDVMGSLRQNSNFATQYQSDPTGGMMGNRPRFGWGGGF